MARLMETKEETENFEAVYYKKYCEEYNKNRKNMERYEYKCKYLSNALEYYLGEEYSKVNEYMRNPECIIEGSKEEYNALIDRLHEIIFLAPVLPEDIWVYRGIDDKELALIKNGIDKYGSFYPQSFLSTSMRLQTVKKEFPSQYYLKLLVKKGTHALCVNQIKNRDEEEILFPANMAIRDILWKKKEAVFEGWT